MILTNRKLKIVSVTIEEDPQEDTLLGRSMDKLSKIHNADISIEWVVNRTSRSLAKIYNEQIYKTNDYFDYMLFVHDDVSIEDGKLIEKLNDAIGNKSDYAICGLAGSKECFIRDKNLWHIMNSKGKPFHNCSGAVAHYTGKDYTECFMSNFGVTPSRVVLLDGLFLAVNVKKIKRVNLKFDENNPSKFHFYDILFCLDANNLGLKMTTWPIWVVHRSHGLNDINNVEWNKGNNYLLNKNK